MTTQSVRIRKLAISGVFLAVALVLKQFTSFYIPLFGENGMRMGISGIFTMVPAILFGPLYGGTVSALSDLLGYLLKPTGAYMPLMTISAFVGGFLRGALWMLLRGKSDKKLRIAVIATVVLLGAVGVWNSVALAADGVDGLFYETAGDYGTNGMHLISRMLIERTVSSSDPGGYLATYITYCTTGLISFAGFGIVLVAADLLLKRFLKGENAEIGVMSILIALLLSGLVNTTLNTIILRETIYESWKLLPFSVVWLPRAVEEILANTVKAYFVVVLYGVFMRQESLRRIAMWEPRPPRTIDKL